MVIIELCKVYACETLRLHSAWVHKCMHHTPSTFAIESRSKILKYQNMFSLGYILLISYINMFYCYWFFFQFYINHWWNLLFLFLLFFWYVSHFDRGGLKDEVLFWVVEKCCLPHLQSPQPPINTNSNVKVGSPTEHTF